MSVVYKFYTSILECIAYTYTHWLLSQDFLFTTTLIFPSIGTVKLDVSICSTKAAKSNEILIAS